MINISPGTIRKWQTSYFEQAVVGQWVEYRSLIQVPKVFFLVFCQYLGKNPWLGSGEHGLG